MSAMLSSDAALDFASTRGDQFSQRKACLLQAIERASHMLPAQGPINVFIHHNTLHAFEGLPFDQAVVAGGKIFDCQPYLSEERFREKLARGRIQEDDLRDILFRDLADRQDDCVGSLRRRIDLRMAMLRYPLRMAPPAELRWFIAETDALQKFREDLPAQHKDDYLSRARQALAPELAAAAERVAAEGPYDLLTELLQQHRSRPERWSAESWENGVITLLWRVCRQGVHALKAEHAAAREVRRPRDILLQAAGADSDILVHEVLIRLCAAFLDQGQSTWLLPRRAEGLFRAFIGQYKQTAGPPDRWLAALPGELARIDAAGLSAVDSILESIDLLGIEAQHLDAFLVPTLLALRGWGGMIHQIEIRSDRVPCPIPPNSLVAFVAVRLILERLALAHLARESLNYSGPLSQLSRAARTRIRRRPADGVEQRAFLVFQLAQVMGWLPTDLQKLGKPQWQELIQEIETFSSLERRRVFQAAFERRYRVQALDAITTHATRQVVALEKPKFQLMCCLDEREESFRRHLEEIEPAVQTYGVAGFYNVPMYYRGAAEANYVPLCPIIIQPKHWVKEEVACTYDELHGRRAKARRVLGRTSHQLHVGTRTITGGALITAGLGALAAIPLVARVLFPRLTAQIRRLAGSLVEAPTATKLRLEHSPAADHDDGHVGFSLEEMVNIGERLLRDVGLTKDFARLVVMLGHGSFSLNNPHNSAYNCGACGGSAGGPNARAFAQLMNDPRVREALKARGIHVPFETRFLGGYHNTCNDEVEFFDLDQLPATHKADFAQLRGVIDETCDRNAHERCRRFMSAPLSLSAAGAKRHVEGRSEDLAQTRPELGHATNAQCIVARRSRTRGLFLDRRAFLTSYDPTQDDADASILLRLLQAAAPVCAGINLEYYFSQVDPTGFGCGTKLPHNVTSLLGVMDGAASDLRTGLPWQMVEIHEPMRLLFVIETTPAAMLKLMDRDPAIGQLCRNGWVQVTTLDPESNALHLLHGDHFERYEPENQELQQAASSQQWYQGQRDHLGFAQIAAVTA